jgi:hypothetical protein
LAGVNIWFVSVTLKLTVLFDDDVVEMGIVFDRGDVPGLPHFGVEFLLWFHLFPTTYYLMHGLGGNFYVIFHFNFRP